MALHGTGTTFVFGADVHWLTVAMGAPCTGRPVTARGFGTCVCREQIDAQNADASTRSEVSDEQGRGGVPLPLLMSPPFSWDHDLRSKSGVKWIGLPPTYNSSEGKPPRVGRFAYFDRVVKHGAGDTKNCVDQQMESRSADDEPALRKCRVEFFRHEYVG